MSTANHIQGKSFGLEFFDTSDSLWKRIGGITTKDMSMDNPAVDVTSQSTTGDISESAYAGYSDFTINGSGTADVRDTSSLAGYERFALACMSGNREVKLRLSDAYITHTGDFLVTNYAANAEERGLVQFSMSAQIAGNYVRS